VEYKSALTGPENADPIYDTIVLKKDQVIYAFAYFPSNPVSAFKNTFGDTSNRKCFRISYVVHRSSRIVVLSDASTKVLFPLKHNNTFLPSFVFGCIDKIPSPFSIDEQNFFSRFSIVTLVDDSNSSS